MFQLQRFLVEQIVNSVPYVPSCVDIEPDFVRLNSNENYHPLPPGVIAKLREIDMSKINFYPHETAIGLRQAASKAYGIPAGNISVGVGSSDILSYLFRIFIGSGEHAAMPSPGFTYNHMLASLQGGSVREIPWGEDYGLPIEELLQSNSKMLIIVNPNNPTGTTVSHESIKVLLENFKGPVIVDEAYIDFCGETVIPYIKDYSNLIVLRTLSKAYSAAGVRVGFCFACEEMITEINKVRGQYSTNIISEQVAQIILDNIDCFSSTILEINSETARTALRLDRLGFKSIRSKANFTLAEIPVGIDVIDLKNKLEQRKFLIRHFSTPSLKNRIRVSTGTRAQMDVFFDELKLLLSQ